MLLSDGGNGLEDRGARVEEEGGGARPLPLPRTLPPPSFRADMIAVESGLPEVGNSTPPWGHYAVVGWNDGMDMISQSKSCGKGGGGGRHEG